MESSKLIRLLKSLKRNELKPLKRFLSSPYFNSRQRLLDLYLILTKYHPDYKNKLLQKERVWKSLYPDKKFQAKKMTDLMSELAVLVQQFMVVEELNSNKKMMDHAMSNSFFQRGLADFYNKLVDGCEKEIAETGICSPDDLLLSYFLNDGAYYHSQNPKTPPAGFKLKKASDSLNQFYLLSKLKIELELQNRAKIFSDKEDINFKAIPVSVSQQFQDNPLIKIYTGIIALEQNPDTYAAVKAYIFEQFPILSKSQKGRFLQFLINHISFKYHRGDSDLTLELLDLYKKGLAESLFTESGEIRHTSFLNIAVLASISKDFKFCQKFIAKYAPIINETFRKETQLLAAANNLFYMGEHEKSIEKLSDLNHSKLPEFTLRIKNLEIKSFFELGLKDASYWKVFNSKLDAYTKFLSRNNYAVEGNRLLAYKNFVHITKKISILKQKSIWTEKNKKEMLNMITSTDQIISIPWLKKIIEEGSSPSSKKISSQ